MAGIMVVLLSLLNTFGKGGSSVSTKSGCFTSVLGWSDCAFSGTVFVTWGSGGKFTKFWHWKKLKW